MFIFRYIDKYACLADGIAIRYKNRPYDITDSDVDELKRKLNVRDIWRMDVEETKYWTFGKISGDETYVEQQVSINGKKCNLVINPKLLDKMRIEDEYDAIFWTSVPPILEKHFKRMGKRDIRKFEWVREIGSSMMELQPAGFREANFCNSDYCFTYDLSFTDDKIKLGKIRDITDTEYLYIQDAKLTSKFKLSNAENLGR